jgi:hypothetical protein
MPVGSPILSKVYLTKIVLYLCLLLSIGQFLDKPLLLFVHWNCLKIVSKLYLVLFTGGLHWWTELQRNELTNCKTKK